VSKDRCKGYMPGAGDLYARGVPQGPGFNILETALCQLRRIGVKILGGFNHEVVGADSFEG